MKRRTTGPRHAPGFMPGNEGGAQRASGISGRRLDPNVFEELFSENPSVGHAVQGHASREAQILLPEFSSRACRANRSMTSSVTSWMERATSIWRSTGRLPELAGRAAEQFFEPVD